MIIEAAIERGDQGFRGGFVEFEKASEMTGLKGVELSRLLVGMGYINLKAKVLGRTRVEKTTTIYTADENKKADDFWWENDYYTEAYTKTLDLIKSGEQGFRKGWVSLGHLRTHLGRDVNIKREMNQAGYHMIKQATRRMNGDVFTTTLYHTDPNANPADFWKDNGYA